MIFIDTLQEMKSVSADLASDSTVQSVGVIHLRGSRALNRTFHAGHVYLASVVKSQFDKLIVMLLPSPVISIRGYKFDNPLESTYAIQDEGGPGIVELSQDALDYIELQFPFVDYLHPLTIEKNIAQRVVEMVHDPAYHAFLSKFPFYENFNHQNYLHLLLNTALMKRPVFPELSGKAEIVTSRKDTRHRLRLWNTHKQNKGQLFKSVANSPSILTVSLTNLTVNNRLAPLYRDAEGLIPEINEPVNVRVARLEIHNVLHGYVGTSFSELKQQLEQVQLPKDYTLVVEAFDYETVDGVNHPEVTDTLPAFGEIRVNILDLNDIQLHYEDYRYLGTDETKWFDVVNLTDL